ncbi:DUF1707 domain-containing protein [Pseudonocardia nantongensis]|uniref:DUF1707 SHOCT-like domain-containing protein n=1 Tax=Pseudonocardia nantongensis TaxID=1181885 RepID=UPI0039783FB4
MGDPGDDGGLVRVSDAERQETADRLKMAHDEGRLALTEYDERIRDAYAARTRAELDTLLADLPAVRATDVPAVRERRAAEQRAESRAEYLTQWRSWAGTSVMLIGIWGVISLATGSAAFFWPIFPIGIWGVVLLSQLITGRNGD